MVGVTFSFIGVFFPNVGLHLPESSCLSLVFTQGLMIQFITTYWNIVNKAIVSPAHVRHVYTWERCLLLAVTLDLSGWRAKSQMSPAGPDRMLSNWHGVKHGTEPRAGGRCLRAVRSMTGGRYIVSGGPYGVRKRPIVSPQCDDLVHDRPMCVFWRDRLLKSFIVVLYVIMCHIQARILV